MSGKLRRSLAALVLGAGLASVPASLRADDNSATWSEEISAELNKLDGFQKEKKFDDADAFLLALIKKAKPESYDEVMLLQFRAKFFLMDNKLNEAVQPFERSLEIGLRKHYLRPDDAEWTRFYLAQIYYSQGATKGIGVQNQKALFKKAAASMEEWFANNNGRVNSDASVFYANILYNLAQINSEVQGKLDPEYLAKARKAIENAMSEAPKIKENLYLLMVAVLQQQEDFRLAADYLEKLLTIQPNNKVTWTQLFASYYQIAADSKDPRDVFTYNLRAILTMDRAQKLGFMNEQKDNFNRVGIYFNIQQFEKATELLYNGLKDGSIENTQKNWELLAYSYQQIHQEEKAIKCLGEATKLYPDKGQLYFQIAQNYYNIEQPIKALEACQKALTIGSLEKPYMVYSFAAYMAFELRKFDDALVLINKALEFPESKKDSQLNRLKSATEDSIKERELNKQAIEQQHKNR